jgi:MtaA/CmuA family methyltransferase
MNVLNKKPADILPRLPILMAFAANYIGSNYGQFASDYRVLVESNLTCIRDFDFDQVSAISDPYRETQGFGAEIEYIKDGVPRCKKFPLQDTKDLSVLEKPDPYSSERMLDRIKALDAFKKEVYQTYSILGWAEGPAAEAADLRGVTTFLMDLYDDESFVNDLLDICTEVGISFSLAQLEAGADTIGVGDAICSQLSPQVYQEFILPRQKRLVNAIHDAGGYVRLHICGDTTHILPFVQELHVDIYDCDWQVDMNNARKQVGSDVVLTGNLDPVNVVKNKSPEEIVDQFRQVYNTVGDPYMLGAGCEIPPGTANENLKALCTRIPV